MAQLNIGLAFGDDDDEPRAHHAHPDTAHEAANLAKENAKQRRQDLGWLYIDRGSIGYNRDELIKDARRKLGRDSWRGVERDLSALLHKGKIVHSKMRRDGESGRSQVVYIAARFKTNDN